MFAIAHNQSNPFLTADESCRFAADNNRPVVRKLTALDERRQIHCYLHGYLWYNFAVIL
jgi:hypothetical protein